MPHQIVGHYLLLNDRHRRLDLFPTLMASQIKIERMGVEARHSLSLPRQRNLFPGLSELNWPMDIEQIMCTLPSETNIQADHPHGCVHELFEAQVERTHNAVALVYGKEELSYRELDNQAHRVANHLRSLRFGPDVPVGICAQCSGEG